MSWAKRAIEQGAVIPLPGKRLAERPQAVATGISTSIDIAPAVRLLEASKRAIGMTAQTVVKMLAVEMAGTMATATRISPKVRPIVTRNPKGENRSESRTFFAKGFVNGVPTYKRIYAETPAEARMHPLAQIKRRGLARQAWFWIIGALGEQGEQSGYQGGVLPSAYNVWRNDAGLEMRMTSKLRYADQAFFRKGRATVDNASERVLGRVKRRLRYLDMLRKENMGVA